MSPTTKHQQGYFSRIPAGSKSDTQPDSILLMGSTSLKRLPPASPTGARCSKKEAACYGCSEQEGSLPHMTKPPRSPFAPTFKERHDDYAMDLAPLRSPLHRVSGPFGRSIFPCAQTTSTTLTDIHFAERSSCSASLKSNVVSQANNSSILGSAPRQETNGDPDGDVSRLLHQTAGLALDCQSHV
jgi:hypothetical protein